MARSGWRRRDGREELRDDAQGRAGVRRELLLGLAVCVPLVGVLGGWAATTRLDGAVVAGGRLTVSDKVKQVQHRDGGIVSAILVQDGARVVAGQPLMQLDDTAVRGNHAITVAQLVDFVARRHRLRAEQAGVDMADNAPPLPGMEGLEQELARAMASETTLFRARQTALKGQKESIAEQIRQLRAGVADWRRDFGDEGPGEIYGRGTGQRPGADGAGADDAAAGIAAAARTGRTGGHRRAARIGDRAIEIAIARSELESLQIDLEAREKAEQELREADASIAELLERRKATQDQLERLVVLAPGAGVVSQLAVHTVGGVIAAGAVLALIVPEDDHLIVEARIRPVDIDGVAAGQTARIQGAHAGFEAASGHGRRGDVGFGGRHRAAGNPGELLSGADRHRRGGAGRGGNASLPRACRPRYFLPPPAGVPRCNI